MPPAKRKLLDDCFLHDKDRLRHETAVDILKSNLSAVSEVETIALEYATGRVLAETIQATRNIPSTDNSAVDGYAYRAEDYETTGGFFPVVTRIAAGDTSEIEMPPKCAARIFTGAIMPQGADTVAMQEDCEPHEQDGGQFIAIPPGLKAGANRRKAGEDLKTGETIATIGRYIDPALISAIASTGQHQVVVFKPLKIALFSNGKELREPGSDATNGEVYDSNRYLLKSLMANIPVELTDLGILPDDYDVIRDTIKNAAGTHDAILTSGGASRGEEDHIIDALDDLGKRHLWQLAIKPGRPMTFGQIEDTVVFGLPGNPVACLVCFLLYVRPALMKLNGADWQEPRRYPLPASFAIDIKKPDRREFWRGMVRTDEDGKPFLDKFARDGSGLITGLRVADGLIEVLEETTSVAVGEMLNFIPWSEFGL